jgi:arylsulfatase A-like enzyme
VLFKTDHGICLGEHNRTGKSNINDNDDRFWPVYPEIAHVPFMIAAPGLEGGTEVGILAQAADVFPTLLDLLGVEVDPPEPMHGRSFAAHLKGESTDPIRDLVVAAACIKAPESFPRPCGMMPVVYTGQWAYAPVGSAGEKELYDIEDDPTALTNVVGENEGVVRELHGKVVGLLEEIDAPENQVGLWQLDK